MLDKYTYTNGCPQGQFGRITKVKDVRNAVRTDQRLSPQLDFNDVNHIGLNEPRALEFNKPRMPGLHEFASLPDALAFFNSQFQFKGSTAPFNSVNINPTSSTGIWSGRGNKKNKECNFQTLFSLAEGAMRMYESSGQVPNAYFTGVIKNKAEVYERDEVLEKTRNIISFNFPATVILQMAQYPVFKNKPIDVDQVLKYQKGPLKFYSYNIAGYSPVNSFFQKMYTEM